MTFIHLCSFIKKRLEKILGDFKLVRGGIRTDVVHVSDLSMKHIKRQFSKKYE